MKEQDDTMKKLLIWLCALFITACIPTKTTENKLQDILDKAWQYRIDQNPSFATSMGKSDKSHLLAEITEDKFLKDQSFWKGIKEELNELDTLGMSKAEKVNYQMFGFLVDDRIAQVDFKSYLIPVNAEGGFYTSFAFTPRSMPFKNKKDYQNYLSRLEAFPRYARQHMALMRKGMEQGMMPPRVILESHPGMIDSYLQNDGEASIYYSPFNQMKGGLNADEQTKLRTSALQVIEDSVLGAYREIRSFLTDEYIPAARESLGAKDLPNGKAYYEQRVKYFTTLPYSSEEIFEIGEKEVSRIEAEMQAIIDSLGFEGSFADFLQFLRTDPQFYAKNPRQLLEKATFISKKIDGLLPKYFGKLPRLPYGVEPVPDAIAPNYTGGRYVPGSLANNKAGTYWVNTYKLDSRTLYTLPALTLHEAVPGHHLQHALAEELEAMPEFRRHTYINSYGEGWALYTEKLGKEMAVYENLYEEFGRLTYEMWRACRLVVDVGLHMKDWSRQQAVDYLASHTALSLHEVNTEIDRYIGWPGQALSYKMGELTIVRLRKEAEEKLGDKFDLKAFHDVILSQGAVPMFVLEEMVNEFVLSVKKETAQI